MARSLFRPPPVSTTGARVRFDTLSGVDSPAVVSPIGSGMPIEGAVVRSDPSTGALPSIVGPDGVNVLYRKTLDFRGTPTGEVVTVTGTPDQSGVSADAGARVGLGNRFVFLGDSTTIGSTDGLDVTAQNRWGNAWPTYAHMLSGGRIRHLANAAKGGTKTDDMLANFDVRVAPYKPTAVVILAGTNDIDGSANWAVPYKANYQAIVAKVRGIGATPVICTVIPNTNSGPTGRTTIQQANAWLRWYASSNGFPLVDFNRVLINPADGAFAAGMSTDGLHPNAAGNVVLAQEFVNTILPLVPPDDALLPNDTYNNLVSGLFLTDTTGVPAGWSAFGPGATLVNTVATEPPILGRVAQIAVTDTTTRGLLVQVSSGWAVGDRMAWCGRVQYTYGGSGNGLRARVNAFGASVEFSANYDLATTFGPGIWYREFTVPAATTRLDVYLTAANGTAKFSQVGLYNLTALGIPAGGGVPLT